MYLPFRPHRQGRRRGRPAGPAWREQDRLLWSIKGVGPVVGHTLLADLPELGTRPPGKLAALAGVAPFAADSGRRRGERHIRGGRWEVRRAL